MAGDGLKLAVVGSGPAGCYAAERLVKSESAGEVDVYDRLPTPFGLVRFGVAPDHQSIKNVSRVMARVLSRDDVRFVGNVRVGVDVSVAELQEAYDAVLIACGAPVDRNLGVPGEELAGVYGSGAFTGWYNGHPDFAGLSPDLSRVRSAVVVGNGNVALDVARLLVKTDEELAGSDLAPDVTASLTSSPLERVAILGRRGPPEAKFSPAEIREFGELSRVQLSAPGVSLAAAADGADNSKVLEILRNAIEQRSAPADIDLAFLFQHKPEEFLGDDEGRVRAVRARIMAAKGEGRYEETGDTIDLPADLVVTCIGYGCAALGEVAPKNGVFPNENGRIDSGLYVTGWAKRGPSGTIGTNRGESHAVADMILEQLDPAGKPGFGVIAPLLAERGVKAVDWEGWLRIEAAEIEAAGPGRVRRKFPDVASMTEAAGVG